MGVAGLAELLDWGGVRADPTPRRHLVVEALDSFPAQASDAATLLEDFADVVLGALRLRDSTSADSLHLLVPERRGLADQFREGDGPAWLELPELHPLGDPEILSSWLAAHPRFDGASRGDFRIVRAETAAAIGSAAAGRLRLERWISIAGLVREPRTVQVPLGTTVATLRRLAGGATQADCVPFVVTGAALRRASPSCGVDRHHSAVLFLAGDHALARNDTMALATALRRLDAACTRCGFCEAVCPAGDGGLRLLAFVDALRWGEPDGPRPPSDLAGCVGCRLCETACPANLAVGRTAWEVSGRLRERGVAGDAPAGSRLVAREAFRRSLGVGPDPVARVDARSAVRRVRLPLGAPDGSRAVPCCLPGDSVWRGDSLAIFPDGRGRVLAPFTGRVRAVGDAVTVGRVS